MSTKKKLELARDLIKQKRYDEAQTALRGVNHPKAEAWLAKLNAMQQHAAQPATSKRNPPTPADAPESTDANTTEVSGFLLLGLGILGLFGLGLYAFVTTSLAPTNAGPPPVTTTSNQYMSFAYPASWRSVDLAQTDPGLYAGTCEPVQSDCLAALESRRGDIGLLMLRVDKPIFMDRPPTTDAFERLIYSSYSEVYATTDFIGRQAVDIDGFEGFQREAVLRESYNGEPDFYTYSIVFEDNNFLYWLLGFADPGMDAERRLAMFDGVRDSIVLVYK